MSEAVTLPNLMMMTLIVSEESLARDRHTHTHTDSDQLSSLKFALQTVKSIISHVLLRDQYVAKVATSKTRFGGVIKSQLKRDD